MLAGIIKNFILPFGILRFYNVFYISNCFRTRFTAINARDYFPEIIVNETVLSPAKQEGEIGQ
jgi:hypothetical protein